MHGEATKSVNDDRLLLLLLLSSDSDTYVARYRRTVFSTAISRVRVISFPSSIMEKPLSKLIHRPYVSKRSRRSTPIMTKVRILWCGSDRENDIFARDIAREGVAKLSERT